MDWGPALFISPCASINIQPAHPSRSSHMWRGRSHVLSTLKPTVATLQRTCSRVESLWSFLHLLWNSHCAAVGVEMVLWAWASAAANPDVLIASWKWCRGLWKHMVCVHECVMGSSKLTSVSPLLLCAVSDRLSLSDAVQSWIPSKNSLFIELSLLLHHQ